MQTPRFFVRVVRLFTPVDKQRRFEEIEFEVCAAALREDGQEALGAVPWHAGHELAERQTAAVRELERHLADELSPADYEAIADVFRILRQWDDERKARRKTTSEHPTPTAPDRAAAGRTRRRAASRPRRARPR